MTSSAADVVVVGVDGSRSSYDAVSWAAREAADRHGELRVVHGFFWPLVRIPEFGPISGERQGLRDAARTMLDDAADRARALAPDLTVHAELVTGDAVAALVDRSREASVVVVGSRGLGGFSGLLVGSVALAVAARGHAPVVVVRGPEPGRDSAGGPVVVGVDREGSDPALGFAFAAAARREAELIGVRAWGARTLDVLGAVGQSRPAWPETEAAIAQELATAVAPWRERYPGVVVRGRVVRGRPAAELVRESERAQLLVVGSRGRGDVSGLLLGSVSRVAIQHARCPVVVVRPGPADAGALR